MQQIFIELYKYRQAWLDMDAVGREQVAATVRGAMRDLGAAGVEVVGWGFNDLETDHRAPFDFFCVYKVPSFEFQRGFDQSISQSGWHELFEQVAASGMIESPADILAANVALERPSPRT